MNKIKVISYALLSLLTLTICTACSGDTDSTAETTQPTTQVTTQAPTEAPTEPTTHTTAQVTTADDIESDKVYTFKDIAFCAPSSWYNIPNDDMCAFMPDINDSESGLFAIQANELGDMSEELNYDAAISAYKSHYTILASDEANSYYIKGKSLCYYDDKDYLTMTVLFTHGNYMYHFTYTMSTDKGDTVFSDVCPRIFKAIVFND